MTSEAENELKPCPFCGDEPKYSYNDFFKRHSYGCANAMCSVNPSDNSHNNSKQEAKKIWNTRTDTIAEKDEAIRMLREAVDLFRVFGKFHIKDGSCVDIGGKIYSAKDCGEILFEALSATAKFEEQDK